MKTINLASQPAESGKNPFSAMLNKMFAGGQDRESDLDAQEQVVLRLERALAEDFTLIREITIPGLGTSIPMVLVGPPGIYVLYASGIKGTFRARGDAWLKLDNSGNMRASNPNLPNRTRLYSEAIRKFLTQNEFQNMEIEPVLLFSQPEAFVENIKAPIRMVMCDGLESYSGSLRLLNPIFSPEERSSIVRLLSNPEGKLTISEEIAAEQEEITPQPVIMPSEEPPVEESVQEADFISEDVMRSAFYEQHPESLSIPLPPIIEEAVEQAPTSTFSVAALLARTHMNSTQITLLGVFALLDLLAICGLLAFVLFGILR